VIFITVGSMLPFDRLIREVDSWAQGSGRNDLFAQIGNGEYQPRNMPWVRTLAPSEFGEKVRSSSLLVSHAGMGTILSAMEAGKPIVVLPRRVADREVTTDHQVNTASWLKDKAGVFIASTEGDLPDAITTALSSHHNDLTRIHEYAPEEFTAKVRKFLLE